MLGLRQSNMIGRGGGLNRRRNPVILPGMKTFRATGFLLSLLASAVLAAERPPADDQAGPPLGKCSEQTYRARSLREAKIELDGRADEPAWGEAAVEKRFVFPWKQAPAPGTEFRALCDSTNFYWSFKVRDADIVALDNLRDEEDAVLEDRVEIYLSLDDRMEKYYCLEVDSRGRVFDYAGSYYRRLNSAWNLEGLAAKAASLPDGYEIEGRIPLKSLAALGFPELGPGVKIRFGLYRAEFSHDRTGRSAERRESIHTMGRRVEGPPPIEEWLSWVDPVTKEPDFHVPATLGWLEIVR